MSVEKRMIVAVVVSAAIIIVWNIFFMPMPTPRPQEQAEGEADTEASSARAQGEPSEEPGEPGEQAQAEFEAEAGRPDEAIFSEELQSVLVETDLYKVQLSNAAGGSATSWILKNYESSFSREPLDLVAPEQIRPEDQLLPLATMLRREPEDLEGPPSYRHLPHMPTLSGDVAGGQAAFDSEGNARIVFEYFEPDVGWIVKELTFRRDSYLLDVKFKVDLERRGVEALIIWGPGVGELVKGLPDNPETARENNGFILRSNQDPVREMAWVAERTIAKDVEPAERLRQLGDPFVETMVDSMAVWAGVENAYFMAMAVGKGSERFAPVFKLTGSTRVAEAAAEERFLQFPYIGLKTRTYDAEFYLYVGPKDLAILEDPKYGSIKEVVQFGWFSFVSRPALWLLQQIYGFVGNYGFAIIILTLIVNVLLLPLLIKQRTSMAAMQRLQPLIKEIQAKYKVERGDEINVRQAKKQKLNEELMALYKAEGVNPMSGCLPLLIQMPILFALFDMFRVAIELRKAPFVFWIDNLAAPDPLYITPVLMGLAMFAAMKLTPTNPEQGGGMMMMMPVIFVFFGMNFPSGLVIYWMTSSLVNFAIQYVMNMINPVKPAAATARKAIAAKAGKGKKKSGRK